MTLKNNNFLSFFLSFRSQVLTQFTSVRYQAVSFKRALREKEHPKFRPFPSFFLARSIYGERKPALLQQFVIAFSFVALIQVEKNNSLSFDLSGPLLLT